MWKRFSRSRDLDIGYSTLIHTDVEECYLDTIPEVDSIRSGVSSVVNPALPDLPFKAVEPLDPSKRHFDDYRSSSVYSDLPREHPSNNAPRHSLYLSPSDNDVSPPVSVRGSADFDHTQSPHISPIEEELAIQDRWPPNTEPLFKSQSPLLRKASPSPVMPVPDSDNAREKSRPPSFPTEPHGRGTKWNDFSGGPIVSSTLKQGTMQPASAMPQVMKPESKDDTMQVVATLRKGDPARRKVTSKKPPPTPPLDPMDNPVQRPPWKGASGRTTLVSPIGNDRNARLEPSQIPDNNYRHDLATNTNRATNITPTAKVKSGTKSLAEQTIDDTIKPTVPLKFGNSTPRLVSPSTADLVQRSISPPLTSTLASPVTPTPAQQRSMSSEESTPTVQRPHELSHALPRSQGDSFPSSCLSVSEEHPSSRFSWTTYATSANESPPPTPGLNLDAHPLPPMPDAIPSPLRMRKRPIPSRSDPAFDTAVVRKPASPSQSRSPSSFTTTGSNLSKSLPQCPPEMEATDKIATLEARLDDLSRRKRNINKIIIELTSVIQPTSFVYDTATREEVKRTIASLTNELAEINHEKHDIGMRMHRAQRKRDRDDGYSNPTGLWIKRVTS